jgi:hypothetical protein
VATGYSTGEYDAENDMYVLRDLHAHTWPEVFFPGYGWVEFEPTSALPPIVRALSPPGGEATGEMGVGEEIEEFLEPEFPFFDEWGSTAVPPRSFWERVPWQLAFLPILFLFVILVVWYLWQRNLSKLAYPAQVYEKMCQLAALAGLKAELQQTPREYVHRLSIALPQGAVDADRIAESYMKAEYGKKVVEQRERENIEEAWQRLKKELLLRILRWKRTAERRRR